MRKVKSILSGLYHLGECKSVFYHTVDGLFFLVTVIANISLIVASVVHVCQTFSQQILKCLKCLLKLKEKNISKT